MKNNRSPDKKEEEKLIRPALPLDQQFKDDEYELPEGDMEAIQYLMSVRQQAEEKEEVYKSKNYHLYLSNTQTQNGGNIYQSQRMSLTQSIFQPSEILVNEQSIYQDRDIVVGSNTYDKNKNSLWDLEWVKLLLDQRIQTRAQLLQLQKQIPKAQRYINADVYFEYLEKQTNYEDKIVVLASEVVLQEIFGIFAIERQCDWLEKKQIPELDLKIIYGLLCLLEKPLLPDQAADLNHLLSILLKFRQQLKVEIQQDADKLSMLDINIALITEYFDQRFK
ncbi:UNKNOWN [Stylonychia lemnae]|uniref:Uncharacterized protein n=1 Tax=Stylonychia lemnae TaxID=5949 RepID=A0A078ANJ5_STYLE|nr:UNKNOWN [Stylonychia lemnae]|eukprot:CDW83501.1 UNKNOWN [Stylonychia lemnae]